MFFYSINCTEEKFFSSTFSNISLISQCYLRNQSKMNFKRTSIYVFTILRQKIHWLENKYIPKEREREKESDQLASLSYLTLKYVEHR
jgi:hypothetical protein